MNKLDKMTVRRRIPNPKVTANVTGDDYNVLVDAVNTLADEVDAIVAPEYDLTDEQVAAISGANNPGVGNVFATMGDIPVVGTVLTEDEVGAIQNANGPSAANSFLTIDDFADIPSALNTKTYAAFITQSGTNAPTATVLENTLGATPVWARTGVGVYTATTVGYFTVNKTVPNNNPELYVDSVTGNKITAVRTSANVITVTTTNSSDVATDGVLTNRYIQIVVYK